jgi:hypothetical protein
MEIVAHGLWAAAAVVGVRRTTHVRPSIAWTVWWAVFPDVFAFGPSIAAGLALLVAGKIGAASHGFPPRVHFSVPLYPAAHSLLVFAAVFGLTCLVARRIVYSMLGWLMHILIDIPTHSYSYYATRFLWPLFNVRVDGIAWWTPWFWVATYAALATVYFLMWRAGWFAREARRTAGKALGEHRGSASG